ncbi:hypothetical protein E3P81_01545 [Wallemia ichthyophaga]|nr:hypothetical protein E3P97_01546 [Wallemia ichthyophaga]TIB33666.1 hypothetical protein E3P85_01198 [Wallemia ichthyophaga]TIB47709.1 hypothetical protein E3P82_01544 [Wallemia ichthyophaga]TIB52058.1 hypothetical protein E3P81_01545 [Wallemia ichthyophaga]TIB54821.1 hypothetical protein E3P80_01545 [Wallemia ichthyophaga]
MLTCSTGSLAVYRIRVGARLPAPLWMASLLLFASNTYIPATFIGNTLTRAHKYQIQASKIMSYYAEFDCLTMLIFQRLMFTLSVLFCCVVFNSIARSVKCEIQTV